jgi:hypothetical protein
MISLEQSDVSKVNLQLSKQTAEEQGQPLLWMVATLAKILPWISWIQPNYRPYEFEAYGQ